MPDLEHALATLDVKIAEHTTAIKALRRAKRFITQHPDMLDVLSVTDAIGNLNTKEQSQ